MQIYYKVKKKKSASSLSFANAPKATILGEKNSSIYKAGSGPPCTKNIPHLHTLGPQFWFWTTLYEKHTTSSYTRTPILVLDHLVRKTYLIYIHSDPNSGSGPPCTKNIPHLHTLGPQFWFWTTLYEKHTTSTYTRTPIIYVRGTRLAYTRATTNRLTRRGARPTPLAGPPTILLRNNKKINQRPAYMHNVREAFAAAPTPTPSAMPSAARTAVVYLGYRVRQRTPLL